MCIIVHRSKGARVISIAEWTRMASVNSDGYGIMYHDGRKVCTYHTMKDADWIATGQMLEEADIEFAAHARITTHGKTNEYNCHPFQTTPGTYLMHNGILNIAPIGDRSDTRTFTEYVLAHMPADWYTNTALVFLVEEYVEAQKSKFVIMGADGSVLVLNARAGEYEDDKKLWFSNASYKWSRLSSDPRVTRVNKWRDDEGAAWDAKHRNPTGKTTPSTAVTNTSTMLSDKAYLAARYPGVNLTSDTPSAFDDIESALDSVEADGPADTSLALLSMVSQDEAEETGEESLAESFGLTHDDVVAIDMFNGELVCLDCMAAMGFDQTDGSPQTCTMVQGYSCSCCETLLVSSSGSELEFTV